MPLVEASDLSKIFWVRESAFRRQRAHAVRALDGVSIAIAAGETLGLVGESGSGKSTLGRIVLRLLEPTSGTIRFDGRDLLTAGRTELRRLRADMQIIFQDPFSSLDPRMRVKDLVAEPLLIHKERRAGTEILPQPLSHRDRQARLRLKVQELLRAVGLDPSAMERFPHEFSGGQRQRIAIARALALRPKFIVCDEPVSALDVSVAAQIVNLLAQVQREFGLTYLFISHSMPIVRYLSTRIAVMYRGRIVEIDSAEAITRHPQHPYTKTLLAATPEMSGPGIEPPPSMSKN